MVFLISFCYGFALQLHVISFGCFCITNDKFGGPTRTTSFFFIQIIYYYTINHLSSLFIYKSSFIPPIISQDRLLSLKFSGRKNIIKYSPGKFIDFLVKMLRLQFFL